MVRCVEPDNTFPITVPTRWTTCTPQTRHLEMGIFSMFSEGMCASNVPAVGSAASAVTSSL